MSHDQIDEHISRSEFQNLREDINEKFTHVNSGLAECHICDDRIEEKIDGLVEKIDPILKDYVKKQNEIQAGKIRKWDIRLIILGSSIGAAFSLMTAIILYVTGITN